MKVKAADVLADFLAEKNIRHVFGIIGSGNAHIFDAITRKGFTEIVCVHHEQAAVMAMGTYYRTRGVVTAAILTTGAGSTNGITGVVSTWMDSIPGLIISSNENSKFTTPDNPLRIWGIQGYSSPEMVKNHTKYANRVMDAEKITYELEKSYYEATSGRPGPIWLDIPMNVQAMMVEKETLQHFTPPAAPKPDLTASIDRIFTDIAAAERPLIWLGHGIRLAGGHELIDSVLRTFNSPALVTWNGIDMIDSQHPLVFGRAGTYGQRAANLVLQNCDYILAIGTRLAIPQVGYELSEFARAAKNIAVVDIDPLELKKHAERVTTPILSDAKVFMEALLDRAKTTKLQLKPQSREAWIGACRRFKEKYPVVGPEHKDVDGYINSYPFMDKLSKIMKPDQIVVTDMGTALLSGHQVLSFSKQQRMMTSTGLGEMGFGLPAAIGASFGRDRGEVLCLNCDGGMMMNLQELQTIAHHQLPIKIIIFNNDGYLMIKHTQKAMLQGRYSATNKASGVSCPDYAKIAKAFDFPAMAIRTWQDFDTVMPKVLDAKGPVICEVFMHPEQLLVPKLSLSVKKDGTLVSPPLEDLSPLLSRAEMRENMIIGLHPKSESLDS